MIPFEYVSHSRLELFKKNPVLYKKTYIDKVEKFDPSAAMILGSFVHSMVLEPENVDKEFAVAPVCDKRTKEGKANWDAFKNSLAEGMEVITHDDVDQANRMIAAIHDNSATSYLLGKEVVKESEILIDTVVDGEPLKIKFIPDLYCTEKLFLADLKTVSSYDPLDWGKECAYNGYMRQLALYRFCLRSMGVPIRECYHIVVDKGVYPSCMVAQFESSDIDRAENQVFENIRAFLAAHKENKFVPAYYGIIPKISAPAWAWR